ncbi:MAG: glycosyltransferase [Dermabacter sp.]|nr:glycosyltransferase [Dermabacter sp.]
MPLEVSPDLVPLYVESTSALSGTTTTSSNSGALGSSGLGGSSAAKAQAQAQQPMQGSAAAFDPTQKMSRRGVTVPSGQLRSLGTYFNAFPASYWRRWTRVRSVTLTIRTQGPGQVIVYKSNARGDAQRLESAQVRGETTSTFTLSLDSFGDGGWIWFDAYAASRALEIQGACYSADASLARTEGTFSLAMTTMNKVDYALDNIRTVAGSEDLRRALDTMYVVDQGTDRLRDHEDELAPLRAALGDQLTLIDQGNIGGSGGFSRGMYEAAQTGGTDYVITCDDDLSLEPESVVRLVTFADFCTKPTLVGAHMFDINARSVLHAFGETVDPWSTQPTKPHADMTLRHDFSAFPLRSTPWLHRRVDVDYNGWWMCLIPTEIVREIGLSLPVFIKWDDAEYGLRAKAAGYPTVSLPGAGVWHVAWADKDDANDWQAYFHHRNRVVTALLHSPFKRGGGTVRNSQLIDLKHLLSMQYSTEAVRKLAQDDIMRGPGVLHEEIGTKLPQIRSLMGEHEDAVLRNDIDDFPSVYMSRPPNKGRPITYPSRLKLPLVTAKTLAKQLVQKPREGAEEHPQAILPFQDAKWWRLSRFDSALVSNAGGSKVSWYRRDPQKARAALGAAVSANLELMRRWDELVATYRAAARDITSFEAWERTFANNPAPAPKDEREAAGKEGAE